MTIICFADNEPETSDVQMSACGCRNPGGQAMPTNLQTVHAIRTWDKACVLLPSPPLNSADAHKQKLSRISENIRILFSK